MESYPTHVFPDATVAEVQPDARRLFLVVSGTRPSTGRPWTLVLERENDYWISRRELDEIVAPAEAVSGFLFNREGYQDPVALFRRMNDLIRTEYYQVLQEKIRSERARRELAEELARARDLAESLRRKLRLQERGGRTPRRTPSLRRRPK
jgi:hypothetical protein